MNRTIAIRAAPGGLWLIVLAATLWGTVGIATRAIYELTGVRSPLSVGLFRLALAASALLLACWLALGPRMWRVTRRDLVLMLLIGLAMAVYQVTYFAAIAIVGVSVAVLVALCTSPVLVALIAARLLGERLTRTVLLALGGAIAGTVLLVSSGGGAARPLEQTLAGAGLALITGLSYAVVTVCSRALAGRYHPLQPIAIGFSFGALALLPFTLATGLVLSYPWQGWLLLLHLGLVPTAFAYVLFLRGMRTVAATTASIVTLLEPLTSTVLAWALFGERLGPLGIAGGALLLGAITLLSYNQQ